MSDLLSGTGGKTKGSPSEELRQLVQYMEHSTWDNAKTDGLIRLHQMITDVIVSENDLKVLDVWFQAARRTESLAGFMESI